MLRPLKEGVGPARVFLFQRGDPMAELTHAASSSASTRDGS